MCSAHLITLGIKEPVQDQQAGGTETPPNRLPGFKEKHPRAPHLFWWCPAPPSGSSPPLLESCSLPEVPLPSSLPLAVPRQLPAVSGTEQRETADYLATRRCKRTPRMLQPSSSRDCRGAARQPVGPREHLLILIPRSPHPREHTQRSHRPTTTPLARIRRSQVASGESHQISSINHESESTHATLSSSELRGLDLPTQVAKWGGDGDRCSRPPPPDGRRVLELPSHTHTNAHFFCFQRANVPFRKAQRYHGVKLCIGAALPVSRDSERATGRSISLLPAF